MAGVLDSLLEGFAAEQADPFPDQDFTNGDQVRVSVGNGASSITGRVMRPHGGPPPTHAVVSPEGGGAHVLAPVGQVKLNTPGQHAAAAKRAERQQAKRDQDQATAAWMAAKPPGAKPPGKVREGLELLLEGFAIPAAAPPETPAQSQVRGAAQVAAARRSLAAGWNAAKHPRARGGKFAYTTGGKRATRGHARKGATGSPRTLNTGSRGSLVSSIQRTLNVPQDGVYGPQTKGAVARYQRQHGLQVDGIVGAQTLASLRGSTNARLVAPGPITSRQARLTAHRASTSHRSRKPARPAKPAAPVRIGGGVVV